MSETTTKNTGGERKSTRRNRGGHSTGPTREENITFTNGRATDNHKPSLAEEIKPKPDMDPIGSLPKDKVAEGATGNNSWPPNFKNATPKDMPSKTPVSILQEVLSRKGLTPKYELLQEEGAIHEPTFRYRVTVQPDLIATGTGRSKKEAKHAAAKAILDKLRGKPDMMFTFPDFKMDTDSTADVGEGEGCENPIGVLQELCMSKRWPPPTYHTEREEGLPHERQFTIACTVFRFKETGTGKSKKIAKRLAAHRMLVFLRGIPSEDNNGASFGLDDDDELAQQLSQANIDYNDLKNFKANMLSQNLKVTQFHKSLKNSKGPKLNELQNMKLNSGDIDFKHVLKEISDEQVFIATYVDIEEKTASGKYQCLVQLSTVPVSVCCGNGKSVEDAQADAAKNTLEFLKLMSKK